MSDSLLAQVWFSIPVLVITCVLLHWILIWGWGLRPLGWRPLPSVWWKRADYVWLFLTGLSIILYGYQAQRFFAERDWEANFGQLDFAQGRLTEAVESYRARACERVAKRTEHSPPDFDEIVAQAEIACQTALNMKMALGSFLFTRGRAAAFTSAFEPPAALTNRILLSDQGAVRDAYLELVARETDDAKFLTRKAKQPLEEILLVFAPLILAMAFALRIARVTADLRFERARMPST